MPKPTSIIKNNDYKAWVHSLKAQAQSSQIKTFKQSHDRFLILDNQEVYHFGASLKDLGKKWFAFSKFDKGALDVLEKLAHA